MFESLEKSIESNVSALNQRWPMKRKSLSQLNPDEHLIPLPPSDNIRRVTGSDWDPEFFRVSGRIDAQVIVNIAEVYGVCDSPLVLDWGAGCGRVARHLPLDWDVTLMDVDQVNVDWCRQSLGAEAMRISHDADQFPVLQYHSAYDLVYGISVFTHLCEQDQIAWLKAISSVCRGLMVFSVHGFKATIPASWAKIPSELLRWLDYGFKDSHQQNHDIDGQVPDMYYTDTAHTPAYIREVWSSVVDVIDIIPGAISQSHDAVVCRRKS